MLTSTIKSIAVILLLIIASTVTAYPQKQNPDPNSHREVQDDNYMPIPAEQFESSPAYRYSRSNITTVQVNVTSAGQNIIGDAANEPSIAIDRTNPLRMAIGWRQFNTINNNFRQAGYAYTTNAGSSWTFPGVINPGVFRSDPVLESDAEGNFYYNSLAGNFYCKVFKSSTGGATWDTGTDAQGGDKQWMTIDKTGGIGDGNIYASWTSAYSVCPPGFFTRSTNGGFSFESCMTIPDEPYWGTLAVGPSGELYVAGAGNSGFVIAKSLNAQNPGEVPVWNPSVWINLDGSITFSTLPNPGGLGGQTNVSVDTSGGPYTGNVYVLCSVLRHSSSDPSDVMFVRSTNGGLNWSLPLKVNDDQGTSAYQWFGTMSVAPTGRIDVVWLDTRDNAANISALYYANSTDGGVTFSENVRISDFFNSHLGWPQQNKMGDYFDMISDSGGAHLAWAATFNGEQDVYYSYISETVVPVELVSFSAVSEADIVTLNWTTATEINNYGFEIERSIDRTNWKVIGFKGGKGTTSEYQQYSFTDRLNDIASIKLYYRLKQVDYNGSFVYSEVAEVHAVRNFTLFQNYPNPFNPATVFSYSLPVSGHVIFKIYDVLGNELVTLVNEVKSAGTYELEFNADELTSGIYFYRLQCGDFSSTKKMMLMR